MWAANSSVGGWIPTYATNQRQPINSSIDRWPSVSNWAATATSSGSAIPVGYSTSWMSATPRNYTGRSVKARVIVKKNGETTSHTSHIINEDNIHDLIERCVGQFGVPYDYIITKYLTKGQAITVIVEA